MRKLLLVSFLFFGCFLANAQLSYINVLHYRFEITLNDKNDTIYGKAQITTRYKSLGVSFDLTNIKANGKGMKVDSIKSKRLQHWGNFIPGSPDTIIRRPISRHNKDIVSLYRPGHPDNTDTTTSIDTVIIYYHGIPDDGLIISKNKYGDRTFFADNWPDRAHHWIPCIDRPDDKATFEFIVTAPSHYSVVSNGTKTEEKEIGDGKKVTHWKEATALPTKVMVIGVARFAVKTYEDSPPGVPVSAWVYPQDSLPGFKNYSVAPAILKFLTGYIGPYPYEKLANVQSKTIFGGMENASAIFYEETSASLYQTIESLMAHEITHQWFGDMASEKSFPHLWLSEGFATYLTHIYMESKYGTDSLNHEMKNDRDEIIDFAKGSRNPVVDSVSSLMKLLNPNNYQKGGWILHMLRRQLSDPVFHRIIRNYYAAYAGKNADTRDFERICEQESRKDLKVFFDQWLYQPGLPRLDVQWNYDEKSKAVVLNIKQMQRSLFRFPLEVEIRTVSGKPQLQTLDIKAESQEFSFPLQQKPVQVTLDPNTSLLFEGSVSIKK